MSFTRNIDATMKSFECSIDGNPISLDHVKQLNSNLHIGIVGEPGNITITYDMYKMISKEKQKYSPIGKEISFTIKDDKAGTRQYTGVVTAYRKIHNVKQDLLLISFDKPKYIKANQVVWVEYFKDKTIVEIFEEFLNAQGLELNNEPSGHAKERGTFWPEYAIPMNKPTMEFLLSELAKDELVVYINPEKESVTLVSWRDMMQLDVINSNNPDYVVDGVLAKFDESKNEWKETTFIHGKQIDTRSPWRIHEWMASFNPDVTEDTTFTHSWYSGAKCNHPIFNENIGSPEPNEFNDYSPDVGYNGKQLKETEMQPYPSNKVLRKNTDAPKNDTTGYDVVNQHRIHPRYMFWRMRESYATNIKWVNANMTVAGSAKMVVPFSTLMVTYFENAMNEHKDRLANGDQIQSGLYLILGSTLSIAGNNIVCKFEMAKPYK